MTAAFSERDILRIEGEALRHFQCASVGASWKEPRDRIRKRDAVSKTVARGMEVLNSDNPPKSRDEAIRLIVGVVAMALAFLFPQYKLAIQVAGWLWDYLNATQQTAGASGER